MADRTYEFAVKATDEFSATFGNAAKDIENLRKQLKLPLDGPLTKVQQTLENSALAKIRGMEQAGIKARMDGVVNRAIGIDDSGGGGGGPARTRAQQQARDAEALQLRIARATRAGGGYGSDVTRLRGGFDAVGSKAKADEGLFESINKQKEKLEKILKLGGAIGIADLVGRSLQGIPAAVDKFHDDIKSGSTRTQAFGTALADLVPGAGELAKGFRALYDSIDAEASDRNDRQRKSEEQQDQRNTRQSVADKRDATRRAILQSGKDVALEAADRLGVAGTRGDARTIAEAGVSRDQEMRRLNDLAAKRGSLSGDQAKELDAEVAKGRAAAAAEYDEKIANINREAEKRETATAREHADRIRDINNEAYNAGLERQGKFFTEKLKGIEDEAAKEREAARRAYDDALKDPDQDPAAAAKRRDEAIAYANGRSRQKTAAARQQDEREQRDARREFTKQSVDADVDLATRRMKMVGQTAEADKIAVRQQYADRLADIKNNLDKEVEAHAERAPELRAQAARAAEQASREYSVALDEMEQERQNRFRPDFAGGIGEAGAQRGVIGSTSMGQSGGANYAERIAKATEDSKKAQVESRAFLEQIAAALKAGGVKLVVAKPA